jgi:hypothetical protein
MGVGRIYLCLNVRKEAHRGLWKSLLNLDKLGSGSLCYVLGFWKKHATNVSSGRNIIIKKKDHKIVSVHAPLLMGSLN